MMNDRKTRALVGGGSVILVLLLKRLYRVYTVRKLRKKVEERRKERQEDFDSLAEKLQEDGVSLNFESLESIFHIAKFLQVFVIYKIL